ncbi:hypothetical protein M2404_001697 [Rheinheimera pacifica]|uniref:S1/P1 nuclease n=1 Tax=Rheinheimera pacifica TaxID=173990 RepID=UPI002168AA4E|nr:S1/P1 nuclease [Rheinheimera pacifica]MCS4307370.1 hypothetical protein [Rheinheimera pacifica]
MRVLLAALLLIISLPGQAFSKTGHLLICDMAYQLASEDTRLQIDSLLKHTPYSGFGPACSWADDIRLQPEFAWSSSHHYVNMRRGETAVNMAHCPEQGCILSAINDMQQRLVQNNTDWQALLFLAHHIGDLHQPLHVSFEDDLGGNRTAVYFYGLPNNLHGVWDFALLKQAGYETDYTKAAKLFNRLNAEQRLSWQQGDVLSWANESASLTLDIYLHYRPGMLLDDSYMQRYLDTLEQRLLQAAVRLALWLDQSLAGRAN